MHEHENNAKQSLKNGDIFYAKFWVAKQVIWHHGNSHNYVAQEALHKWDELNPFSCLKVT